MAATALCCAATVLQPTRHRAHRYDGKTRLRRLRTYAACTGGVCVPDERRRRRVENVDDEAQQQR